MEFLSAIWVTPINFLGDCIRRLIGAGPKWKMHLSLARKLVERGSWFAIPLTSGTQSPIFDAMSYIVKVNDRASIPRLERLFEKYCQSSKKIRGTHLDVGEITYCFGPQDYMPLDVQFAAAKSLIGLYSHQEAEKFISAAFDKEILGKLCSNTIRELLSYSIRVRLNIDPRRLQNAFDRATPWRIYGDLFFD